VSDDNLKEQAPFQVVSDLGQLKVFTQPLQVGILRILQHQEVPMDQLVEMIGEPRETVSSHVRELVSLGMVELVARDEEHGGIYRAKARIFQLYPNRGHEPSLSTTITPAAIATGTAESVGRELGASLTAWPDQVMNFEARRVRMSSERISEFNEKMVELVHEYWGGPDGLVAEDPNDPVMSFIGLWYRFPEKL
jgi:hypothetical protein